jgi:L-threonylcarbamoyladenylate synthase
LNKNQKISGQFKKIDPIHPEQHVILTAARIIEQGGVVVFPTRNLYGLAADAFHDSAIERIFKIKHRQPTKPLLVLIHDIAELENLVEDIPSAARRLMEHFWPGKVTIILTAKDTLPQRLTAGTGRIGVRLPGHPVASAMLRAVGIPVTGTSANLSGTGGCSRLSDMDSVITENVDLILDAGSLDEGIGSTIVDVTTEGVQIIREAAVSAKDIHTVLNN